jgi:hypothetical protein
MLINSVIYHLRAQALSARPPPAVAAAGAVHHPPRRRGLHLLHLPSLRQTAAALRVRVEIMGPGKCRIVGKSQPALIMIDPIIFTRTRTEAPWLANGGHGASSKQAVPPVGSPPTTLRCPRHRDPPLPTAAAAAAAVAAAPSEPTARSSRASVAVDGSSSSDCHRCRRRCYAFVVPKGG